MKTTRVLKIAEQLSREINDIVVRSGDPRLAPVLVTRVKVSSDLQRAQVFFQLRSDGLPAKEVLRALDRARGYFRHSLTQRMQLRHTPQLEFLEDRGQKNADRVETLLQRIRKRAGSSTASLLVVSLLCSASGKLGGASLPERYEAAASAMGCTYTVTAYGTRRGHLASAVQAAFEEVERIDRWLSHYKPDSELSRLNRLSPSAPRKLSAEMAALLVRCREYSRLTDGGFDITVGPLMALWGFAEGAGRVPSRQAIRGTLLDVGYRHLVVDEGQRTVYFRRPGVRLDPGGIGKGYAVDRMVEVLREAGVQVALVNACGSSFYGLGSPPSEPRGWYVRIRDPEKPGSRVAELHLKDQSLSTSGSYEKFFEVNGRRYSHLLDPRTGLALEGAQSVSVVAPSTLDSEAWATALLVNGLEWSRAHKPDGLRVHMCLDGGFCGWL